MPLTPQSLRRWCNWFRWLHDSRICSGRRRHRSSRYQRCCRNCRSCCLGVSHHLRCRRCINLGRNEPDAWSTFNGEIGDVFLYKSALSDAERKELVNFVAAKLVGGGESGAAK